MCHSWLKKNWFNAASNTTALLNRLLYDR
jgi:hypothetical protein